MSEESLRLLSRYFENIQDLTKAGNFINCFDRFAVIIFIHNNSAPPEKRVRFSDLSKYIKQSDVYLANLIKEGTERGYIKIHTCPDDRRRKSYELTDKSISRLYSVVKDNGII